MFAPALVAQSDTSVMTTSPSPTGLRGREFVACSARVPTDVRGPEDYPLRRGCSHGRRQKLLFRRSTSVRLADTRWAALGALLAASSQRFVAETLHPPKRGVTKRMFLLLRLNSANLSNTCA